MEVGLMDATVDALWRYPVKSLQGTPVDRVDVRTDGVAGDRQWGIVDVETGKVLSAKRWPMLLEASADLDGNGGVVMKLPDGTTCASSDAGADAVLSGWLDHEVRLTRAIAAQSTPYELTMDPTDDDSEPWDFATPPGSFVDVCAVHVVTTASLAAIAERYPDGQWDVHRFRPTVLVDTGSEAGFVEDAWVGGQVQVGGSVIDVFMATPRCAMPGRAQPAHGLGRDKAILTTLRDEHQNNLGIYATVASAGTVTLGDPVRPV
jgi:uncharacterized protein YcbX